MLHRRYGGPGCQACHRLRVELERCGGDDAQRAFAADEQVAQVIAGVVLAQAGQAVPDVPLRRDHFKAQTQVARVAVAHHLRAARVGCQVTADGAAAFGGQTERKQKAGLFRSFLQGLQNTAGVHRHGHVGRVDVSHRIHALQAQHHLPARAIGNRADHQPGIATLGDDAHAGCYTGLHDGRYLLRAAGPRHGQRLAARTFAPVLFIGCQVAANQHMRSAGDAAQRFNQRGWVVHGASAPATAASGAEAAGFFSRTRTCSAQAANSIRHSTISIMAR